MLCNAFGLPGCQLEKLNLARCGFTSEGCRWVAGGFSFGPTFLKQLDISRNHLGDSDVAAFFLFLKTIRFSLETLRVSDCKLTERCCPELVEALSSKLTNLKELDLSRNELGDSGVKTICMGLTSTTCKLERLFLRCCGITAEGCSS
ncbi:ribonuclease inhibitor-like [Coregonus clupeaformis]|nr:ribonuclease inhibitor-like [Coregonus clupeaformis]